MSKIRLTKESSLDIFWVTFFLESWSTCGLHCPARRLPAHDRQPAWLLVRPLADPRLTPTPTADAAPGPARFWLAWPLGALALVHASQVYQPGRHSVGGRRWSNRGKEVRNLYLSIFSFLHKHTNQIVANLGLKCALRRPNMYCSMWVDILSEFCWPVALLIEDSWKLLPTLGNNSLHKITEREKYLLQVYATILEWCTISIL